MMAARKIVEDVLSPSTTRSLWTANYNKALPISVQSFDLAAVLPAVFYMFRFGWRRGAGTFLETFGPDTGTPSERKRGTTISRVASKLAESDCFVAFNSEVEEAILGDLLLCFCLENRRRALGRTEQVQRVAPTHYMSNWVDLPDSVGHLRYVPEMIVSMLANQSGEDIQLTGKQDQTWFAVGEGHEHNVLLSAFRQGVEFCGELSSHRSDRFNEGDNSVGLDQLLTIRLAQQLGEAPQKLRGKEGPAISNQKPIAERAASRFSQDIRRFVRSYASLIPRHAFVELLESCISVGLTTILTSTVETLSEWSRTGRIPAQAEQNPAGVFVDCSNGADRRLRMIAEQSLDDVMRRVERFPVVLMQLRLLDTSARYNRNIKKLKVPTKPSATEWLDLLGELLHERHSEAQLIFANLENKAQELADRMEEDYPEAAQVLRNDAVERNPVLRLAEALTQLTGRTKGRQRLLDLLDSAWLVGRPNGLAAKRMTMRNDPETGARRRREVRSLVFTDATLDYLVHLQVLKSGNNKGARPLAIKEFIRNLRERYGFHVDAPPLGIPASDDLLRENRAVLERRLRDLGLLEGVNDAEAMKRLKPRFYLTEEAPDD